MTNKEMHSSFTPEQRAAIIDRIAPDAPEDLRTAYINGGLEALEDME